MTQSGGRITCPRCGTNNFNTVTACWKCGTALAAGRAMPAMAPAPLPNTPRQEYSSSYVPPVMSVSGDPAVAKRAAFWLAVTFPYFGLPIGWAFMMVEDHKRQTIGKYCATWSIVALIFHCLFLFASIQVTMSRLLPFLMNTAASAQRGVGSGGGFDSDPLRDLHP